MNIALPVVMSLSLLTSSATTTTLPQPSADYAPLPPTLDRPNGKPWSLAGKWLEDGSLVLPKDHATALDLYLRRWQQYPSACQAALDAKQDKCNFYLEAALDVVEADARASTVETGIENAGRWAWWEVALLGAGVAVAAGGVGFVGGALWAR